MLSGHGDTQSLAAVVNGCNARRARPFDVALRALGVAGLAGVVVGALGLAACAATGPTHYVPGRSGGWPGWLSGPLHGLGLSLTPDRFQTLTLVMCAGYGAALLAARALSGRIVAAAIIAAGVALLLGPPLVSQDVFGYLSFARLGALHGLDPYTHVAAEARLDPLYHFIGWPYQHSPYGPLFTLGSYAIAPLGFAGGIWTLKAVAVLASLGAVALIARAAARMGRSATAAAVFVGLNPVLLELTLGGFHNDTLVLLLLAGALALAAGAAPRLGGAAVAIVAAIGVKASAGLVLPFVVLAPPQWRERARVATSAVGAVVVLAILAIIGFGAHALGFVDALGEQQQLIATHSVPAETARLFGLNGVPEWWRHSFVGAFAIVVAVTLWRTARGADWRAMAGWATLALLLSTAWLLPWYAVWVLPFAALADSRLLRGAALVFCAYAIMIHLPLAEPLLSPPRHILHRHIRPRRAAVVALASRGERHRVVFAGLQVERHVALDLGG
jgi:alpha-1,6-mannosyltransferase